ncbi:HD domain-containing protein, partial [Ruminococcaceae bacterium OttesenSCG-928-A11]|nr:HD domain-containing protein [Ruminococcaceae bacterium OttesenSCG-928-A11]
MVKPQLLEKAKEVYTPSQVKKLLKAINFATKSHEGVKRATGDDYITHPLTVASYLIDWNMDLDSVIAGLLHDVMEDCDVKMSVIKDMFGEEVLRLVDGVTKLGKVRKGMKDIDLYLPQTKDNLTKLLIATGVDIRVIIIKLADRLHNLQTLFALSPAKQRKIAKESLDVFAPLADRMNMGRVRVQIEELSFSYLDPKRFNFLKKQMRRRLGRASKKLDKVRADVKKELTKSGIKFEMDGRVKSIYSLHKKLAKHNQ